MLLLLLLAAAFSAAAKDSPAQRTAEAQALFDKTVKEFHIPSADARGAERDKLLKKAAEGYERLLKKHTDQPTLCAQSLRSLGNVRAAQGLTDDAVKRYDAVAKKYPKHEWEILQAWKSAGDLLWDAGRRAQARAYYAKIVSQHDQPDAPAIYRTVVKGAKARLAE